MICWEMVESPREIVNVTVKWQKTHELIMLLKRITLNRRLNLYNQSLV